MEADEPTCTKEVEKKGAVAFTMDAETPPSPTTGMAKTPFDAWTSDSLNMTNCMDRKGTIATRLMLLA